MRLPVIQGLIRRRLLINFRVDPQVMKRHLPSRFRPKLQDGYAVAGICLIRLEHIRPKMLPEAVGISSENAAHRVAVLWDDEQGVTQEGVFIPRRDTNSKINLLLGGRVFPGEHHSASFEICESESEIKLSMNSDDGTTAVQIAGRISEILPSDSIFPSLSSASSFFASGSLGYSATSNPNRLDGLTLKTKKWQVEPLDIQKVFSTYFADESKFPKGSIHFDNALIMKNLEHEWHTASDLYI